jgi:general secretion pathway protein K
MRSQRGSALVMALLFSAAAGAFALSFVQTTRPEIVQAMRSVDVIRADTAMAAALAWVGNEIANERVLLGHEPAVLNWRFDRAAAQIAVQGESGLVDLNAAAPNLLTALAERLEIDPQSVRSLEKALAERRRNDEKKERVVTGGGVLDSGGAPQQTSRIPHLAALGAMAGLDPTVVDRLAPYVSVYTGEPNPERELAPLPVKEAMEGTVRASGTSTGAAASDTLGESADEVREPDRTEAGRRTDPRNLYRVTVAVILENGFRRVRRAVLWLGSADGRGPGVLDWSAPLADRQGQGESS